MQIKCFGRWNQVPVRCVLHINRFCIEIYNNLSYMWGFPQNPTPLTTQRNPPPLDNEVAKYVILTNGRVPLCIYCFVNVYLYDEMDGRSIFIHHVGHEPGRHINQPLLILARFLSYCPQHLVSSQPYRQSVGPPTWGLPRSLCFLLFVVIV